MSVDKDKACNLTRFAHKGDTPQRLLHHPLEGDAEEAVEKEDVVGSLVVCHDDIGTRLLVVVLTPSHGDGTEG